jgi:hypothetical protein
MPGYLGDPLPVARVDQQLRGERPGRRPLPDGGHHLGTEELFLPALQDELQVTTSSPLATPLSLPHVRMRHGAPMIATGTSSH